MTPAPLPIACLTANPDRGAIHPYVLSGTWIAITVATLLLVCAGMVVSSELYKS